MYHVDNSIDIDVPINLSPEGRLWLKILFQFISMLRNRWGRPDYAELFIFERGNIFFEGLAEELNYEPEVLRERIRKALERAHTGVSEPATAEIICGKGNRKGRFWKRLKIKSL